MKISAIITKIGFKLKKASPEILLATGVVSLVAGTVVACKQTLKAHTVVEEYNKKRAAVTQAVANMQNPEPGIENPVDYTDEDRRKDIFVIYVQTGWDYIKLYAPAIGLGVFGVSCLVGSHIINKKRITLLFAAYKALDESFKRYRNRVIEKYGEEEDFLFKHGLEKTPATTIVDEFGKKKKVAESLDQIYPGASQYAVIWCKETVNSRRYFNMTERDDSYNETFLQSKQDYLNGVLKYKGYLFLSDVLEQLGLERTPASQIVGWTTKYGDGYIDYMTPHKNFLAAHPEYRAKDNQLQDWYLDFNIDGVIWDKI